MSGVSKRQRSANVKREKVTARSLIAKATESRFTLTTQQINQVRVLLEHNDSCSLQSRVSLRKAQSFLKENYDLKMGVDMFERLVCEQLKRTSWGQP
jgi:hypothetical protein